MGLREVFLEEWYQNGLRICSSGDKMGAKSLTEGTA